MAPFVITAAVLLAAGTLMTGVDALLDHPPRGIVVAARLLWCASGVLAVVGVVQSASRLASDAWTGRPVVDLVCGGGVATAAALLLWLFGGGSCVSRPAGEREQRNLGDIER